MKKSILTVTYITKTIKDYKGNNHILKITDQSFDDNYFSLYYSITDKLFYIFGYYGEVMQTTRCKPEAINIYNEMIHDYKNGIVKIKITI